MNILFSNVSSLWKTDYFLYFTANKTLLKMLVYSIKHLCVFLSFQLNNTKFLQPNATKLTMICPWQHLLQVNLIESPETHN